MKKTKKVQIKMLKKKKTDIDLFKEIDYDSLLLYLEMMKDRCSNNQDED